MTRLVAAVLPALAGCVVSVGNGRPAGPTRWQGGAQTRVGAAFVSDEGPDGATAAGPGFGGLVFAGYRFTARATGAVCLDVGAAPDHPTPVERDDASYIYFAWGLLARAEIGRLTGVVWGSYYLGSRAVGRPGDFGFRGTSVDMRGPGLGGAALVRFGPAPLAVEAGPFVHAAFFRAAENDPGSPYDERGIAVRPVTAGLALQFTYGTGER